MSVSQAAGLQPWRHRDSREKPAGGNEGEGRIRIMPPRRDDKLVGRRLRCVRIQLLRLIRVSLGQDLDFSPGARDGPQGSNLELRLEPKPRTAGSILRSNFDRKIDAQSAISAPI